MWDFIKINKNFIFKSFIITICCILFYSFTNSSPKYEYLDSENRIHISSGTLEYYSNYSGTWFRKG